ncbi:MAG: DUF58 domain-containing protein [Phycisphaerales bacterium]|nr:DUF58 domain-containing protein [Phycisphaerales bacterium]
MLRLRYRYHVNFAGLLYLGVTVLVGLAATIRPNNLLVWVFGLLLGLIVISGIISGFMLLRIRLVRLDPVHGRVDRPLELRYAVTNRSRMFPIFDLQIQECDDPGLRRFVEPSKAWVMHAGPRETVHASAIMVPRRRGRLELCGIQAKSSFPFGLIGKSVRVMSDMDTLVFPRTIPLRRSAIESLLGNSGMGGRSAHRIGDGVDYFGLREYRDGDSLRSIAWKRPRPDGELVVIQRSIAAPPRLLLLLDLRRPTENLRVDRAGGADPRDCEEQAISLVASIAETASGLGVECGLRIVGSNLAPLPVRGGRRHLDRMLAQLAAIDLDAPRTVQGQVVPSQTAGALVVIHPDRVDPRLGHEGAWHLLPSSLGEFQAVHEDSPEPGSPEAAA